jgi:aminoglycoside phosphotransferase family enzyme/predicted kinase
MMSDLAQPAGHPTDPSARRGGIEWIQTHISHVFLTEQRVYKFRKPVDFGFVDFSTRYERNVDCEREIALNRRLAPDVYLGVAPLLSARGRHWIGSVCERIPPIPDPPEYCVVMRRLPTGRDALSLLDQGALSELQIDRLAGLIAEFHERCGLGAPAPFSVDDWRARCLEPVEQNFQSLTAAGDDAPDPELLAETAAAMHEFGEKHSDSFDHRRRSGRAVDGHGDLHLQHVWFETDQSQPIIIDCLEFNEKLRRIDAASEVAFLAMDLRYRGHEDLAERFLRTYARDRDDFDLYSVIDFFISYRATVRAKVAAIAAADDSIDGSQRARASASADRHMKLAAEAIRARPNAPLVLVAGVVGSGKSTVANELADRVGGVVVSSDRVRKRMAGLAPTERMHAALDEGPYAADVTELVYAGLLDRARPIVESGRVAILDATFGRCRHREMAAKRARELCVPVHIVEARCSAAVAVARLAHREEMGTDASDAGPALYARSVARFEPVSDGERLHEIHTDIADWRDSIRQLGGELT